MRHRTGKQRIGSPVSIAKPSINAHYAVVTSNQSTPYPAVADDLHLAEKPHARILISQE